MASAARRSHFAWAPGWRGPHRPGSISPLEWTEGMMPLPLRPRTILIAIAVVAVSFLISLKAMDWLSPHGKVVAPVLAELPPLVAAPRSSIVVAPVAIALSAIREVA